MRFTETGKMCASVDRQGELSSIDDEREGPTTGTADEEFVDLKWDDGKRPLVLVTAGKAGVGKSTLINNLLGLKGEQAAEAKPGAEIVTKSIDYYEEVVHGITVRIIDTPSLEAVDLSHEQKQEALETLSDVTDRKVDLMLYCISLVGGRIPKDDQRIVEKLTNIFGAEIWGHTILVLTYGDVVMANLEQEDQEGVTHGDVKSIDQKYRELLVDFTTEFEKILKEAGVRDVAVRSILSSQSDDPDLESALAKLEIVGIPVGRSIEKPPVDWASLLFKEVIKRCRIDAIPALLELTGVAGDVTGGAFEGLWYGTIFGILGVTTVGIIGAILDWVTTADVRGAVVATGNLTNATMPGATGNITNATMAGAITKSTMAGATGWLGIGFIGGFALGGLYHCLYAGKKVKRFTKVRTELEMIIKARKNLEMKMKKSK